jgi:hypothetical protein
MGVVGGVFAGSADAAPITVTVENLAPAQGFFITPMWVAFHNGSFDTYTQGQALGANNPFERLVEDGLTGPISQAFIASPAGVAGGVDRTIAARSGVATPPVFDPGEVAGTTLDVDPAAGRFFTYAAMVIPSNDAFIGNDNPTGIEVFDAAGNFLGPITILVRGTQVRDAGTEANTEQDAAFFNQLVNGDGPSTSDPVSSHPGLLGSVGNPGGTRVILGGTSTFPVSVFFDATATDFTVPDALITRITIVPEPASAAVVLLAAPALLRRRRRDD